MALQVCRKCQMQNAPGAEQCSQCGERLRSSGGIGPVALLVTALIVAGASGLLYFKVWPMIAARSAVGALPADLSKSGAPLEDDIATMSKAFRLPTETVRSVSAAWVASIRQRHPDHEAVEIVSAVAYSVQTLGTRGSIRSYYEEYWALADGGHEPERIRTLLRAQMFRGR